MAVLVHLPDHQLTGTPLEIHAAFRKTAEDYTDLFSGFTFGRPGGPVSSYAVEVAWDNLATAGMLSTANPRLVRHEVQEVAQEYFDSRLKEQFEEIGYDANRLHEVANKFMTSLRGIQEDPKREDLLILA